MTQALNNLIQKQATKLKELNTETRVELAETLGLLYYFKHGNVMQIFERSKLDFSSAKTAYTTGIFNIEDDNTCECLVLRAFYSLVMKKPDTITSKSFDDLDVDKILHLKQSSSITQFSQESHELKACRLIKPLAQNTIKLLTKQKLHSPDRILAQIGLLVQLVQISGQTFLVDLPEKAIQRITDIKNSKIVILSELQNYTLAKFVKLTKQSVDLRPLFFDEDASVQHQPSIDQSIDFNSLVEKNIVLAAYGSCLDKQALSEDVFLVMDLANKGYCNLIKNHTSMMVSENQTLEIKNSSDLITLQCFQPIQKLKVEEHKDLFMALNRNLSKNSADLRLATLKVLIHLFETQTFLIGATANVDSGQVSKFYTGTCPILGKLLEFESIKLAFETERSRETILRNIEVQVSTGLVPEMYMDTVYHLMIGTLWLKFTPGYAPAMSLIQKIILQKPDPYMRKFLRLLESIGHLTQFVNGENEELEQFLATHIKQVKVVAKDSIFEEIYLGDAVGKQDYILVKDFHFNLCKTLIPIIDEVLSHKDYKQIIFELFNRFFEREYLFLHKGRSKEIDLSVGIKEAMVRANRVDSDEFRSKRKMSYGKLCAFVELLSKSNALNKLSPGNTETLIEHLMTLLTSVENSLQKNVLACLLKCSKKTDSFKNKTAKMPKYSKLLEGLADDLKFRSVIPLINFGTTEGGSVNEAYLDQPEEFEVKEEDARQNKRSVKGAVPKLEKEDRLDLLPIIIKLLFSKLVKKQGAINKNNSINDRRNVVFIFLSSLDPATEYSLFFKELLEPFDLGELIESDFMTNEEIRQRLVKVSFNQYANFISTLQILFKQLGTLLQNQDFLEKLSRVLTLMLNLSKQFSGHLKERDEEEATTQQEGEGVTLYKFVGKQSKMCLRKGLKIAKLLSKRFSYDEVYTENFTALLYQELIEDQLSLLRSSYISEKSQLVELLTIGWSGHANTMKGYLKYPAVLPSLIEMLKSTKIDPDNVSLILTMLKNVVTASLDNQQKNQLLTNKVEMDESMVEKSSDSDDYMEPKDEILEVTVQETARAVIRMHVQSIGSNLHIFWKTNQAKLRQSINQSTTPGGNKANQGRLMRERSFQVQVLSSLTFIVSELSSYLPCEQSDDALSFLEMIVSMLSSKGILQANTNSGYISSRTNRNEDLLVFGCSAVISLFKTLLQNSATTSLVSENLLNKVLLMMLNMESKRARENFTEGLQGVLSNTGILKVEVLVAIKDMNSIKKGMADLRLDFDKVLGALERVNQFVEEGLNTTEMSALLFNMLSLVRNDEFSVRDYAQHSISKLVEHIPSTVFIACEKWLLTQIRINNSELVIKSLLSTYKVFINIAHNCPVKGSIAGDLYPLLKAEKNEEDFFSQILSMQIQSRQKALRKLCQLQINVPASSFRKAVLPLVDYLIFDTKSHMQNQRNTVRYKREQSSQLMEDALNVYLAYAKRLTWTDTFKLIRKFLYQIERAQRNSIQYTAEKEDKVMEKTITKSLCKVLEGLSLNQEIDLPDAIQTIDSLAKERDLANPEKYRTEFSALLDELVGKAKDIEEEEESGEEDEDVDVELELGQEDAETDIIQVDKQMRESNDEGLKRNIQMKLQRKVLPVLQRHLFETSKSKKLDKSQGQPPIRSFVAVAIAKIIRKLPMQFFRSQLQKLVNQIVVRGLRSPDLNVREKGRKALIKVLEEVSPRFLQIFFEQMGDNLTRGYQLHVHLYTVHYILNHLTGENMAGDKLTQRLQPGQITSQMLRSMSELLMRELFGDLMEERMLTDTQKKHIKESKARKAIPIFEVFTQYIDFKKSFPDLIAPIVKILEENPNFNRIHQCEELLNKISSQLLKNSTLTGDELLVFLYSIVERGINMTQKTKVNDEKVARDYGAKVDDLFIKKSASELKEISHGIQIEWVKTNQHVSKKKTEEICGRVLANFGLQCLRKAFKQKDLILAGDEHEQRALATIDVKQDLKDKLDPFVVLFLRSFKTFYNPIIVTTLHILVNIIHLGLPSFKTLLKKFLNRIFKLFNTAQNSDHEFLNTLFRCVTELIKTYSVYSDLSEIQLKTLVLIIKNNVVSFQSQSHVFQCLKQIINRKFLCADLYDLMETIEEMMVTNINKTTRAVCANIFVQFILEYPLEQKRLQQHINHMLKNLTYFDTDGRMQLLEVFQVIMEKFPSALLDTYAELFFFTLFLRLVNDPAEKCRIKVAIVLKKLISKASQQRALLETVFKIGQQQAGSEATSADSKQESLMAGKLQLIQLFAECGKLQAADIFRTVDFTASIISKHARIAIKLAEMRAKVSDEVDELEINPVNAEFLKGIDLGDSSADEDGQEEADEENLDENEAKWSKVYMAISALENLFKSCDAKKVMEGFSQELGRDIVTIAWKHSNFWVKFACQRLLGHMFASCLQEKNFSAVFGEVFALKENLLKLIYQMLSVFNTVLMTTDMANQLVKNLIFMQGQLLSKCDVDDETYVKTYKKASFIGRKQMGEQTESTPVKLEALVQFFAVSVQLFASQAESEDKIDNPFLRKCMGPILELVCRTYSDDQMEQGVKDISTELVDQLSSSLEKTFFITEFNRVQQSITRSRMERKVKQRMLAGTQEGQQIKAKKRIAKTIRKKEKKSTKVMKYMMGQNEKQ